MRQWFVLTVFMVVGCGSTTGEVIHDQVPGPQGELGVEVTAAEGMTALALSCDEAAEERCDGVDQNCDGRIDEGCGYQNVGIDLTLVWNSGVAVSLALEGADATVDHAGRGDCDEAPDPARLYSVALSAPTPGTYRVVATPEDECGVELPEGEHTTLSISGSTPSGAFGPLTRELTGEPVELLTLVVTE